MGIGLVTDAHSIFLDEPTTGLDSDSAEALISLLSHLAVVKRRTARPCPYIQACPRHGPYTLKPDPQRSALALTYPRFTCAEALICLLPRQALAKRRTACPLPGMAKSVEQGVA